MTGSGPSSSPPSSPRPAQPLLRPARAEDLPGIARTMARAFTDDPFIRHVVPAAGYDDRIVAMFRSEARWALADITVAVVGDDDGDADADTAGAHAGGDDVVGDVVGAAIWRPPSPRRPNPWQALAGAAGLVRGIGRGLPRMARMFRTVERHHPRTQPHWYLQTIGVARPGLGIGGALLRAGLDRVDAGRMPAYLESSAPGNVPLYERFGFRVVGEIVLPDGGPTLPAMWRDSVT